jgi:hypothetical protein
LDCPGEGGGGGVKIKEAVDLSGENGVCVGKLEEVVLDCPGEECSGRSGGGGKSKVGSLGFPDWGAVDPADDTLEEIEFDC